MQIAEISRKKQPKVSIIVPVYNTEKYLKRCLDSLVNQTLKDIEIICINDGSTDKSQKILNEYALSDKRIVIINQENQGPAKARQAGINIAKGEYIGFVDSDDFIDKKYYEILYKNAKKYDSDISMTDDVLLYCDKKNSKKKCGVSKSARVISTNEDKAKIIITTGICWNKIYKKTFISQNNLNYFGYYPGEDNIFNATSIIKAKKISVIHNAKYYYVQVQNSLTHKFKDKRHFAIFDNYKYIDNWIESQTDLSNTEKNYWKYVNNQRKRKDFKYFYDSMNESCKEGFKLLAGENLKIDNLIISLTSYPERIATVDQTINSLLNQTVKAEKIILWLADEQFPHKENDLPKPLLDLVSKGLTIDWYKDIKSYKKIIPTLIKYPDKVVVTADDDIIYESDRIEKLYKDYIKHPEYIHCHRAHRILFKKKNIYPYNEWKQKIKNVKPSYNNFFTGAGCVLYPPNCFYKDVLSEDLFMQLCPNADDIWLWTMTVLNNKKISIVKGNYTKLNYIEGTQDNALWKSNVLENKNDVQLKKLIEHYPEIMNKLNSSENDCNSFYEQIFSVKNHYMHKIITIFGIKFKLKKYKNIYNKIEKFLHHKIKNKSVLLAELNHCHGECLPGIAKYFIDLGYKVDVLLNSHETFLNPFSDFKNKKITIYSAAPDTIKQILCSNIIKPYDYLYIGSDRLYFDFEGNTVNFTVSYIGKDLKYAPFKTILMCHHADLYEQVKSGKDICIAALAHFPVLNGKDYKMINTHYFKKIKKHNKNKITKFIAIGRIESYRKNHSILLNVVKKLKNEGFTNFKIVIISRSEKFDVPSNIKPYFEFKKKLSYHRMYEEIEQADFLLTLFDTENPEHDRYIVSGSSGSYQLSYGFNIPLLIPYKFQTKANGFNNLNSIGYKDNDDLINAMKFCINMKNKQYNTYKLNLSNLEKQIYNESLENLKSILDEKKEQFLNV